MPCTPSQPRLVQKYLGAQDFSLNSKMPLGPSFAVVRKEASNDGDADKRKHTNNTNHLKNENHNLTPLAQVSNGSGAAAFCLAASPYASNSSSALRRVVPPPKAVFGLTNCSERMLAFTPACSLL